MATDTAAENPQPDPEAEPEYESIRLKTLAEQKYSSGNLKSALKYAKRAVNLHPTAAGVSEILTAFKILHSATVPVISAASAAAGIGNSSAPATTTTPPLPDYYKILQVERFSRTDTIKTQYKKLALALHPDKNPFVASEEAFKVVGEAFRVLSDKIRRKEYDVKLRIAMQSEAAVVAANEDEGDETASFWTACSGCKLLHQFDNKYLGHNLMCPSCKKSFEAIEVEENGEKRVSERIKFRKNVSFGCLRKREVVGKGKMRSVGEVLKRSSGKMTRNIDGIGVGSQVGRGKGVVKVRDVDLEGDVESDDGLIKGLKRSASGKTTRNVDAIGVGSEVGRRKRVVEVRDVDMEGDVESDDCLIKGLRRSASGKMTRTVDEIGEDTEEDVECVDGWIKGLRSRTNGKVRRNVGGGEDTMTLAEMQLLVKKKVNKEKIPVKDKGEDKEENAKAMKFNLTEKGSEKRKEMDLSLIEEEDDVEMETLIARVRENRMRRGALKRDGLEDGGRRRDSSSNKGSKGLRQDDLEIMAENEKEIMFNLTEKDSEKSKETSLSLNEEEDEVEMEALIARVRDKRMRREALKGDGLEDGGKRRDLSNNRDGKWLAQDDSEIMAENGKEDNEIGMTFNSMEKKSEKRKETSLSLVEEEDEVEMETLIARVREKRMRREALKGNGLEKGGRRRRRDLSSKRCCKGSRQDDSEMMSKNEKTMKLNLMEEETNLTLIEEQDEAEMESLIARVRKKRTRREVRRSDVLEDAERRRDLSINTCTLSKSSKKGKWPRQDDLEIVAAESFDLYNFDKDRVGKSFKKGQVWAVYDDDDGMPRDYALIDDVISVYPFEVRLNLLEFQSNSDEALLHWGRRGFHVSCGKFKVSRQILVKSLKKFSHVVDSERAASELYRIYPTKGSIWAVYKENALGAGSRSLMEDKQCYDICVSLSSYTDIHGVSIAYLERVDEFRTIFKRREVGARAVKLLGKDELKLFSHRIPARKLSDEEASNISKYCWELDPSSLPRPINSES
ncbi:hypothetical protein BC332_20519 [Capsicum chinense]|nr:hypothetical protein BC332_20519 [Capsicum chinense]